VTQSNLGFALGQLGGRENGTAKLEEAIAAYREALKEQTRERAPLDWARTQNYLGTALAGTAKLEEAIAAFHEALKEYTPDRAPLQEAAIQNKVDIVLSILGERKSGTSKLEEAARVRALLKEQSNQTGCVRFPQPPNPEAELRYLLSRPGAVVCPPPLGVQSPPRPLFDKALMPQRMSPPKH
jgi:tetratricopeptide (TPR) repeat protein